MIDVTTCKRCGGDSDGLCDRCGLSMQECRAAAKAECFGSGRRVCTGEAGEPCTASVPARPLVRRVLVPLFDLGESPPDGLGALCKPIVKAIRFDASALPVDELVFTVRHDGIELVVDLAVPDRDKPEHIEIIHVWRTQICPWGPIRSNGPEYLVRWMRETIANVLAHEVDESITLGGERVFNPHRPLKGGAE